MEAVMTSEGKRDGGLNISDVLDVIETDLQLADAAMSGYRPVEQAHYGVAAQYAAATPDQFDPLLQARRHARVVITEQPAAKALRFRYECEGRSAGSIPGNTSTADNKTFPSVRVLSYQGPAMVVVSCVTKDPPHYPHPHNLVGKDGCRKGVCTVNINVDTMAATFQNLGIQCVKKKDVEESLRQREAIRVDPFQTGFDHRLQPAAIDLNAVRLCFQVFLEGHDRGKFVVPLKPVVSGPIYDKKSMCDLVICKMSDCSASVAGGRDIILLCDKVAKDDVEVRFFEVRDNHLYWEAFGEFLPAEVHKQVAICFKTPAYIDTEVHAPVRVQIELRRPSDKLLSEPRPFTLTPVETDGIEERKRKMSRNSDRLQRFLSENLGSSDGDHGFDGDGARPKPKVASRARLRQHIKREPVDPAVPQPTFPAASGGVVSPTAMSGGRIVMHQPAAADLQRPPGGAPPADWIKAEYGAASGGDVPPQLFDLDSAGPAGAAHSIELDLSQLNSADLHLLSFPSESDVNAQAIAGHLSTSLAQSLSFLEPPPPPQQHQHQHQHQHQQQQQQQQQQQRQHQQPPQPPPPPSQPQLAAHVDSHMDSLTRSAISELDFLNAMGKR